jgi:hypothetical protein
MKTGFEEIQMINIQKAFGIDISKGKKATIGEIRTWNGKKFKKQSNGKWLMVSGDDMTKKEHEDSQNKEGRLNLHNYHKKQASQLSDKEHSDKEVGLGKYEEDEDGNIINKKGHITSDAQIHNLEEGEKSNYKNMMNRRHNVKTTFNEDYILFTGKKEDVQNAINYHIKNLKKHNDE